MSKLPGQIERTWKRSLVCTDTCKNEPGKWFGSKTPRVYRSLSAEKRALNTHALDVYGEKIQAFSLIYRFSVTEEVTLNILQSFSGIDTRRRMTFAWTDLDRRAYGLTSTFFRSKAVSLIKWNKNLKPDWDTNLNDPSAGLGGQIVILDWFSP